VIPKRFENITKADIDALVTNAVAEGRTIDYKRTLPGGTDDEKREFLANVSSFANAAGGDILYGVEEDKGIPTAANGLPGIDPDAEILRLDNIIRSGIEPRVPAVQIKAVDGFSAGPVMVLRAPKSWSSPHMSRSRASRDSSRGPTLASSRWTWRRSGRRSFCPRNCPSGSGVFGTNGLLALWQERLQCRSCPVPSSCCISYRLHPSPAVSRSTLHRSGSNNSRLRPLLPAAETTASTWTGPSHSRDRARITQYHAATARCFGLDGSRRCGPTLSESRTKALIGLGGGNGPARLGPGPVDR